MPIILIPFMFVFYFAALSIVFVAFGLKALLIVVGLSVLILGGLRL